ncbi:MAG: cytochrome C [Georgfuchsia sp.]
MAISFCLLFSEANAQSIEKALMPGLVITGHAKYEHKCDVCHKRFDKEAQAQLCADCHKPIAKDRADKTGLHGHLEDATCNRCHGEHNGRKANISVIDKEKFDHDRTGYQLKGGHKTIHMKCESCHAPKVKFRDTRKECVSCHRKDDMSKGHKGKLGDQCEKCHGEFKWKEFTYDHEKTRFHLAGGKHEKVECKKCHAENRYKDTPLDCHSCHKKIDEEKGHKGRYGTKCESCHTDIPKPGAIRSSEPQPEPDATIATTPLKPWKDIHFNHDTDTHYILRGKHVSTKCDTCHLPKIGSLYQKNKLSDKCITCHRKVEQEKGHQGKLGEKCETCHNERSWKKTRFDHDKTDYKLLGKHVDAKCDTCHKGGVTGPNAKLKMEKTCVSCHRKNDQEKGHKGRYGEKCEPCHKETDWKTISFNHDKDTKYLLAGKHRQTKCDACHVPEKGLLYQQQKLATNCIACHKKDDKHKGQLDQKCEKCHTEASWKVGNFNHNMSRFPLVGGHVQIECKKCHDSLAYRDAKSTCVPCHNKEDVHKRRLGTACEICHNTRTWKSWDFDHSKTRYPLDGAHLKVECYGCHKSPITGRANISRACISCHAKDDVHLGGFSVQCERCHAATNWRNVKK